jgi:hypothetical protein
MGVIKRWSDTPETRAFNIYVPGVEQSSGMQGFKEQPGQQYQL